MKKLLLTLLIYAYPLSVIVAQAQEVHLIPHIGANLGTYNFNRVMNNTSQQRLAPGINAGLGFNIAFDANRTFILQPELNYSMRNSITDFLSTGTLSAVETGMRLTTQMHYVEVPVLARFDFGIGTRYYINVGPSISYAFAGRESFESATIPGFSNRRVSADFGETFNRWDWGLWLGGGVEIPINDTFILIDGRYGMGFNRLYSNMVLPGAGNESTVAGSDGRSRSFSIGIGYALPL